MNNTVPLKSLSKRFWGQQALKLTHNNQSHRPTLFYQSFKNICISSSSDPFHFHHNHKYQLHNCNPKCNIHNQSQNRISKRSFFDWNSKPSKDDNHMHMYLLRDGNKNLENSALLAIEDYEQALQLQETSEAYTKRGFAYFYIKDYSQAMKDINKAIKLNSRSIEAYCAAASIQIALNQHEEALDYLNSALELTSPVDFRRSSIEEVVRGCKLQLRTAHLMSKKQEQTAEDQTEQQTESMQTTVETTESQNIPEAQIEDESNTNANININNNKTNMADARNIIESIKDPQIGNESEYNEVNGETLQMDGEVIESDSNETNDTTTEGLYKDSAKKMVDVPFDDPSFMNLQKDITQQMVDIGGEEFQQKLMKLNDIPAVQKFQHKALKGEKPSYDDYMELMKDKKFQKYNEVMTEIAKNPKFAHITAKFAQMDWMGAYAELKKDPEALALYMKAFDSLQ